MTATPGVRAHRLGRLDEIPVGEGRAFTVDGEQIAVFRLRDGNARAVSAVCTHAQGPLADGQIDGDVVICPLHQHMFDLATGCSTTGQPPLRSYPLHIDPDGHLFVHI
ncbi:Rieske (2Fe-2S) protein [Sphaerisporangium sp. NPDC005288]|uniref:Rieske (2Fe-2S) protein n=1 Tax=Sphaerisporangium sp. NPDC005288 TaxID=3155114 RepID=UPI0033A03095